MDFRIISIGTLSSHPHWDEPREVRTGHATTTVIKTDDAVLLVDPSLPAQMVDAKIYERWGLRLANVNDVFLTSFDADRTRTLAGLTHAKWYMHEPEIERAKQDACESLQHVERDDDLEKFLDGQLKKLDVFQVPDDHFMSGVDLFPLHGHTLGTCGLLLLTPKRTIVIAGDAVPTREHLDRLTVLPSTTDIESAQDSMKECVEIADIIVPGRDNILLNPLRT